MGNDHGPGETWARRGEASSLLCPGHVPWLRALVPSAATVTEVVPTGSLSRDRLTHSAQAWTSPGTAATPAGPVVPV